MDTNDAKMKLKNTKILKITKSIILILIVFLLIRKRDHGLRIPESSQNNEGYEPPYHNYHFCDDARGRDGHSHASESKERLNRLTTRKI